MPYVPINKAVIRSDVRALEVSRRKIERKEGYRAPKETYGFYEFVDDRKRCWI
jgi:hypothetical protein